jgi:outer membrane immunogenic protein
MKRLAIALFALIGLSVGSGQIASAADLPVKAPPMVAAPVPFSWTGFYVGGNLGGGWSSKKYHDPNYLLCGGGCYDTFATQTINGFLGGFQAGYNYQIDWVVLGIEGDFTFANVNGSIPSGGAWAFCCGNDTITAKADWFATLTGRIGAAVDHALFYVKGGAAWVHDKYSITDTCQSQKNPADCAFLASGGGTKAGWTLGAGVEYAFTRNWSGKLEYDYMDFGTKSTDFSCGPTAGGSGYCAPTFSLNIGQQVQVVKAGVNYRFDWGR